MGISILSTHENSVSQGYAVFIITFPSLMMDAQYFGVVADDFFGKLRIVVELDAEAGNKFFQTTFYILYICEFGFVHCANLSLIRQQSKHRYLHSRVGGNDG